jgi:hypothetical protein
MIPGPELIGTHVIDASFQFRVLNQHQEGKAESQKVLQTAMQATSITSPSQQ